MKCNETKIDKMTLALMYLGLHDKHRVWKSFDWESMNRLHQQGFISNPVGKTKSVTLTDEGLELATKLFKEYFITP